jgi:hypothetical protein
MVRHLIPSFLDNEVEYARAEQYWVSLWNRIDPQSRDLSGWRQPWLRHGRVERAALLDGNPIFSAYAPEHRKGIRIIQHPATTTDLEFEWWMDTFGDPAGDPNSVEELVIACALSEEAAAMAAELLSSWVRGSVVVRS